MIRTLPLRARLTIWYTLLLFAALALLGADVLWQQRRLGLRRLDHEQAAFLSTLANLVRDELTEDPHVATAAKEVVATVGAPDRSVAILDGSGHVLASREAGFAIRGLPPSGDPAASTWTASAPSGDWRVRAERRTFDQGALVLAVANPMTDATREQRAVREAMVVGIPLALAVAAMGGLWLASIGLKPIDEMIARLDAALRAQRQFMADASHELRTPVSVVRTAADVTLGRERRTEAEYREALEIVAAQGRQLGHLVDDLIVLARADAGGCPLRPVDLYLDELVEECRRGVDLLAAARGVTVRTRAAGEIPIRGDEDLLRRMITNLLQNAVQHTPESGAVTVEAGAADGLATIRVSDAGAGIAQADRERIFDRFVQLDPARRAQGTGLGLPIARWIAEAHGGTLTLAESGPRGSTFAVALPTDVDGRLSTVHRREGTADVLTVGR